jgi:hypothetical protein
MKVVINRCYGGFCLSPDAIMAYSELKGLNLVPKESDSEFGITLFYKDGIFTNENYFDELSLDRTDPDLVQVVEELGEIANGEFASLKVIEIPEDMEWEILNYDGLESVHEKHRIFW